MTAASHRHYLVIFNPTARGHRPRRLEAAVAALESAGVTVTVVSTEGPFHAEELARTANGRFTAVLAAGGDGTAHEVANGLMARPAPLALGILPYGTANCLARELGLPLSPAAAAAFLAHGNTVEVPLGQAAHAGGTRHFLVMLGAGFDAHVVARLPPDLKRRLGGLAYALECLRTWAVTQGRLYELSLDGHRVRVGQAVIANGHYYGGRMVLAPGASIYQAGLWACLFERSERWRALRYLTWSVLGRLQRLPDYRLVKASTIGLIGPAGSPVQCDGEIVGTMPMDISVAQRPLPLLVPDRSGHRPQAAGGNGPPDAGGGA